MTVLLPDYSMLAVPITKNGQLTSYLQAIVTDNKIYFSQNTDPNYLAIFNTLFSTNLDRLKAQHRRKSFYRKYSPDKFRSYD